MRKALGAIILWLICVVPALAAGQDSIAGTPEPAPAAQPTGTNAAVTAPAPAADTAVAGGDSAEEEAGREDNLLFTAVAAGEEQRESINLGGTCDCSADSPQRGTLEFYGPLAVVNTHPPNLLFLEPPPETAVVLTPGERFLRTGVQWTNIIIRERDHGTQLFYDYEGLRLATAYHQGVAGGELGVEVPFYYRGPGVLDGLIASWHGWFGLVNGLRDRFPDDQYRFVISKRDGLVYSDGGDVSGIGDITLGFKRQLWNKRQGQDALAVRALLKAPTGEARFALGSGGWDAGLGVLYQRQLRPHLRAYGNVDYVWTGKPAWRNIEHNNLLVSQLALEYAASPRTTVSSMYRLGTNPLRTGSSQGDKNPQELGFGFAHRITGGVVFTGGFLEDISPETAPDFVVTTSLQWSF